MQWSVFCATAVAGIMAFAQNTHAAASVTIDLASEKQSIRGFGGMVHTGWQSYDLNTSDRNLAFGNGPGQIGLTVLRIPVYEAEADWKRELSTAKDVISRGGIVYASAWTAPSTIANPYTFTRWGSTVNSFKIPASNYAAYAAHLNKFTKYMKDNGAPLYAIGFQNEPDWADGWTHWTADELYNFVKAQGANLRQNGTKVITAESFAYNKTYYDQILNDASALANVDIIGAHFYGTNYSSNSDSTKIAYFQYALADQKAPTKERWMTEHYTDSKGNANLWRGYIITGDQDQTPKYDTVRALDVAYEIHRALAEGNFSQYTYWYIRRNYGLIMHDTQANVKPTPTADEVGKVSKRGYCVAQYAKYVRPGAVRVNATQNPEKQVYVSAYKKADSVVVVVVNRAGQSTIDFSVPLGSTIVSWKKITTSETKSLADDGNVTASNGKFSVTFDKQSVTTLIGVTPGASSSSSSQSSSSTTSSSSVSSSSYSSSSIARTPYGGKAQSLPGIIEAENYDMGNEGDAYHDEDATNKGGVYRNDGVDIVGDATSGYKVGYTASGEWLEYRVHVLSDGIFNWQARVSSGAEASSFRMLLDSVAISDSIKVPQGADWDTYTTVSGTTPALTAGEHVLRIVVDGAWFNLDWISFENASDPTPIYPFQQNPTANQSTYSVYNILGHREATFTLEPGIRLEQAVARAVNQSGLYIVRPHSMGAARQVLVP